MPTNIRGIQSFISFANFYYQFIPEFSEVTASLIQLTHKDSIFWIGLAELKSFKKLKELFLTEPVLATFDIDRETKVYIDLSRYTIGGTLSQRDN